MQGNPGTIVEATSFLILPEIRLNSLVSTVLRPAPCSSSKTQGSRVSGVKGALAHIILCWVSGGDWR